MKIPYYEGYCTLTKILKIDTFFGEFVTFAMPFLKNELINKTRITCSVTYAIIRQISTESIPNLF